MSDRLELLVSRLLELSTTDESGAKRLPPERDLGVALDISRGALRELLSQLENLGVLRRIQGHGTYIDAPDVTFIRTYFTLMRQLEYLSDDQFADAREMLEATVAASAAASATDAQVERLRSLVDLMIERTAEGDPTGALEADLAFHDALYAIVSNPIFTMLNEGLSHVLRSNMKVRRDLANAIEERSGDGSMNTDTVHYAIVDAIAAHDPDAARAAMHKHFFDFSLLSLNLRHAASDETGNHS
jgi:GntR family transcriptional repressor for pyruvate dehydrogenase complex